MDTVYLEQGMTCNFFFFCLWTDCHGECLFKKKKDDVFDVISFFPAMSRCSKLKEMMRTGRRKRTGSCTVPSCVNIHSLH